jgi:C-terminal processing protease CtpA/Prc
VRPLTPASSSAAPSAPEDRQVRGRRSNYGIQRIEVLAGNVGYMNLTAFFRPEEARDALVAAMALLRSADALILDMRENGGGSPDTVAFLSSYFFETSNLPLFDIASRQGDVRRYETTHPPVPHRNGARPMYVLTGRGTFSAGEGIAFILQERKRATVIGEQTAGAANPGRPYAAGPFLEVTVPNGQVRTAVTGRNWEGAGVTPDVVAPAQDALRVAHTQGLRDLLKAGGSDPWQDLLRRELEKLTTRLRSELARESSALHGRVDPNTILGSYEIAIDGGR